MPHFTHIVRNGDTHPISPQAVVLLHPTTGNSVVPPSALTDSTGTAFDPDACAHTYAYSNGLLTTDTATDGGVTWVKTYSYTAGALTGETKWVRQ